MITVNAHLINDGKMPMLNKKGSDFYFIECYDTGKYWNKLYP